MGNPEPEHYQNNFINSDPDDYCNKYTVGQFNVNGWSSQKNPYYNIFKLNVLECLNVDIVVLCETHCLNEDQISVKNYTTFQHNRNAIGWGRRDSGGIAICIKIHYFLHTRYLACIEIMMVFWELNFNIDLQNVQLALWVTICPQVISIMGVML